MNNIKALLLSLCIIAPMFILAQPKWNEQTSGTTNHLYGIYFSSRLDGWAVGENGTIIHTTNSGNTWASQSSGLSSPLNAVCFVDSKKGWTVGNKGEILYTLDGGINWLSQTSGTTNNLMSVVFIDSNTGWVAGSNGTILYTTNGGTAWSTQTSSVAPSGNCVDFVNSNYGWVVADNGKIIGTTNGGTNWNAQTSGTSFNLLGVSFADKNFGLAVGIGGTVLKTTNGGNSWKALNSGTPDALLNVHCIDTSEAYIVGINGKILYSNDGGDTWKTINSGLPTTNLRDVFFFKDNPGWICGNNGKILIYNNSEEICLVTVDTLTYKYKLIWEQIPQQGTSYYNIYKLSGTSYINIGTVSYTQLSEFVDFASNPNNKAERYKISAVDSFENESSLSPYHEIMFLQANQGVPATTVNLSWNKYTDESGVFTPEWYYIYRGSSPGSMYLLDSVSGAGSAMYTDNNVISTYFYRVVFAKSNPCYSYVNRRATGGGSYTQSLSNLKDYSVPGAKFLDIYPQSIVINKEAQIVNVNVFTNLASWDISSNQNWAFVIKNVVNKTITVTFAENTNNNSRDAIITLSGIDVSNKFIYITQYGKSSSKREIKKEQNIVLSYDNIHGYIKIYCLNKLSAIKSVEVFTLYSKLIYQSKSHYSDYVTVNTNGFEPGIYLVKITADKIYGFKVIVN